MQSTDAARIFKCLSESLRLRLVRLLSEEELNVRELETILEVPQSTLSRHLAVLKDAGILKTRRQGTWSYYRLEQPTSWNGTGRALVKLVHDLLDRDEHTTPDRDGLAAVLEERRRTIREHFEASGHAWDELNRTHADHGVKTEAIGRLVPDGLVLVDAGCGSGYLLPELLETGARVIAIDNAPGQLAKARQRTQGWARESLEFREGDLAELPIEDGSVDGVFAHLALHHAARPEAAIRDMRRVLRTGGTLVITDFLAHEEAWLREEHADLWLGFDPDEVVAWMAAAGFGSLRKDVRSYARDESRGPKLLANLEVFVLSGRATRREAGPIGAA